MAIFHVVHSKQMVFRKLNPSLKIWANGDFPVGSKNEMTTHRFWFLFKHSCFLINHPKHRNSPKFQSSYSVFEKPLVSDEPSGLSLFYQKNQVRIQFLKNNMFLMNRPEYRDPPRNVECLIVFII